MRPKGMNTGATYEQRLCVLRTLASLFYSKDTYSSKELQTTMSRFVSFNTGTRYKLERAGVLKCNRASKNSTWELNIPSATLLANLHLYANKMTSCSYQEEYVEKRRQAKCNDYRKEITSLRHRIAELEKENQRLRKRKS